TDCRTLDAGFLRQADAALVSGADSVFVPTEDGGFALIGVRRQALEKIAQVFADVPWSTAAVMSAVRANLRRADLRWTELATLIDIDEPAQLKFVPAQWLVPLPDAAEISSEPHT